MNFIKSIFIILSLIAISTLIISCDLFSDDEEKSYTVSFNVNGGSSVANQVIVEGNTLNKPTDPTKTNYTFTNWYSESTLTTLWDFDTDVIKSDITLYAGWETTTETTTEATLTLYMADDSSARGGIDSSNSTVWDYDSNSSVTAKSIGVNGAVFTGWYDAAVDGTLISEDETYSFTLTSDTTLYASYSFTVPYDLDEEDYTITDFWSTTGADADQNEGKRVNTLMASHGDYSYLVFVTNESTSILLGDGSEEPVIGYTGDETDDVVTGYKVKVQKINLSTGSLVSEFYLQNIGDYPESGDDPSDYYALDDGHHTFSIGVDKDGYIHISGDMHNYPIFTSELHMPNNMQNGNVNYWRSTSPEDISSFEWYGAEFDGSAPEGTGHTYMAFTNDFEGELYYYSRVASNTISYGSYRAFLVNKYDTSTKKWTGLGAESQYENLCTIWEDNGEDGDQYSKIHGWLTFDRLGSMHITAPILNWDMPKPDEGHYSTDITYLTSTDYGDNWTRAAGDSVALPVRVDDDTSYDVADVVYHNTEGLQYFSATAADYWGNPIVMVLDDLSDIVRFMVFNSVTGEWVDCGDADVPNGDDTAMHVDENGVITITRDTSKITRMWRPDLPTKEKYIGKGSLQLDRKYLADTGNLLGIYSDDTDAISILKIDITRP